MRITAYCRECGKWLMELDARINTCIDLECPKCGNMNWVGGSTTDDYDARIKVMTTSDILDRDRILAQDKHDRRNPHAQA